MRKKGGRVLPLAKKGCLSSRRLKKKKNTSSVCIYVE